MSRETEGQESESDVTRPAQREPAAYEPPMAEDIDTTLGPAETAAIVAKS